MEYSLRSRQYWDFPIPIHYGPGIRREIAALCKSSRIAAPLVVTDRNTAELPFVVEILELLQAAGLSATLFSEVNSNPVKRNVVDGIRIFHASKSDGVIALGGGSGMDCGKAISYVASAGSDEIWTFDFCNDEPPIRDSSSFFPLICIPTTAGTGAEVDSGAIITDTDNGVKRCLYHADQKPVALLDPELTLGLPANLTAWTGADALVHAIEAYVVPQFHPLCDSIALQSVEMVTGSLRRAVAHGDDIDARAQMLTGSCMAGIAFAKGLGLVHSISHMIGAVYDTHHGLTNAVLLPAVLNFNRPSIEAKVPALCKSMGLKSASYQDFYRTIVELLDDLEIPDSLAALGVQEQDVADLARKSMTDLCLPTNPRAVEVADVEALLYSGLKRTR